MAVLDSGSAAAAWDSGPAPSWETAGGSEELQPHRGSLTRSPVAAAAAGSLLQGGEGERVR